MQLPNGPNILKETGASTANSISTAGFASWAIRTLYIFIVGHYRCLCADLSLCRSEPLYVERIDAVKMT